jgi:hypothetical protein
MKMPARKSAKKSKTKTPSAKKSKSARKLARVRKPAKTKRVAKANKPAEVNKPPGNEKLVFTPGGPRPRRQVHLTEAASEYRIAPGGLRPRTSIRLVESGERFAFGPKAERELRGSESPGPPGDANWITCGYWSDATGAAVTSLVSTWVVPPEPTTKASQLIYLFNGIEPAGGSLILQPVLQWGDSGADEDGQQRTGQFWTIASWLVGGADNSATHTPHIRVSPGETLVGVMKLLSRSSAGCIYSCEFQTRAGTTLITPAIPDLIWCYETLEAYEEEGTHTPPYDLDEASEYPSAASIAFDKIDIVTDVSNPTGAWAVSDTVTQYGERTAIVRGTSTDGEVSIYFHSSFAAAKKQAPARQ